MTKNLSNRLIVAGTTLAVALPGTALAHKGPGHAPFGHHKRIHGATACEALRQGHAPKKLTADQVTKLVAACDTRDAAIKAANDTFRSSTQAAHDAFKATVKSLNAQARDAAKQRRAACKADRTSQACTDARAAFKTTMQSLRDQFRAARVKLHDATAPAAKTRRDAVQAARKAFRDAVRQILSS